MTEPKKKFATLELFKVEISTLKQKVAALESVVNHANQNAFDGINSRLKYIEKQLKEIKK